MDGLEQKFVFRRVKGSKEVVVYEDGIETVEFGKEKVISNLDDGSLGVMWGLEAGF